MQKQLSLLSILFLICLISFGQELPEIFPQSPTTSELGKYGTYPVNLASGLPRIEIPLYTVISGDIEIPIILKYHASGIKVNQVSSWVGLGWALDTGGLISLETRDTPDELEPNPYSIPDITNLTNIIGANPYYFSQPDVADALKYSWVKDAYHINLPTVSGTFFLDSDNDGEVTNKFPPEKFKIYRHKNVNVNDPYLYKIIDKQGLQYEFVDYEESQLNKSASATHIHNIPYKSAWLLNKIVSTKGDTIEYAYGTQFTSLSLGTSHSQSYSYTEHGDGSDEFNVSPWLSNSSTTLSFANKLSEVLFLNGRLRFVTNSNAQFAGGDGQSGVYLDKIIVEKGDVISGYTEIKTIHFEYSITGDATNFMGNNKYRFKLDRVFETYGSTDEKDVVSLAYSPVQLPELTSFSMDYYGYFNGKTNLNLIPKRDVLLPFSGNYYQIGAADRSIDTSKMQAGMLTKIKYPTKGYTNFSYEPNSFYGKNIFIKDETVTETLDIIGIGNGGNPPTELEIQTEVFTFNLNEATTLTLTGTLTCSGCDPVNAKYAYANVRVLNNGTLLDFVGYSDNFLESLVVGPGNVTVVLEVYGSLVEAHIQASYLKKIGNLPDENVQGFGLRIKQITNFDYSDTFLTQKEYIYNTPNTSNSSGKLINSHFNYDRYSDFDFYNLGTCWTPVPVDSRIYTSTYGSSSRSGVENNSITYEYVTEMEKDSLGNSIGRTDYKYTVTPNTVADNNNGSISVNLGHERGQLLKKEIYNDENKILIEEENFYTENQNVSNTREDFKIWSHGDSNLDAHPGCIEPPFTLTETKELLYSNLPIYWYKKDRTENTTYFYNNSGTLINELKTATDYIYNSLNQEIQKITITNSEEEVLETNYKYAQDLNDQQLIINNGISIPLETTILKDTQVISDSRTEYTSFNSLYLPKEIYNKKGALVTLNNSDDRKYTFDSYENGNITQYHIENGNSTSIIWGYNQEYPIAKVENASYSDVSSLVSNLQVKSNLDDDRTIGLAGNEGTLRAALNNLRNLSSLSDAMVTTYTYDPLIGITSITDPQGYTTYYEYDEFNRLKKVKDADGKILSQNEYHYKDQP